MYRLLIVDDEEIIVDGLYEVFSRIMPEQLDVCKAYSAKEALDWMSRTRIDIVLTDIAMPGMNGLEMTENIMAYWPRCRVIFLTGHSEFEYAYRAIQMPNVRYLLKTEGYSKVQDTVREVMEDIRRDQEYQLLEQSRERIYAYEFMAQGDYMRSLLQESLIHCSNEQALADDFRNLNVELDADRNVVLVLGRLSFPEGTSYTKRNETLSSVRSIWDTYMSKQTNSIGITDKYGDMLWFIQPVADAENIQDNRLILFVEGTLELIQEACLASCGLKLGFTLSGSSFSWPMVTSQYERLRRLQQLKVGENIPMILRDQSDQPDGSNEKELIVPSYMADQMASHLEGGRAAEFFEMLTELTHVMLGTGCTAARRTTEMYYSVALVLYAYLTRLGLHERVDRQGKLLRLDEHSSMTEGFAYLRQVAEGIFLLNQKEERDRASQVIDRISLYIEANLSEDLSLVRLAEIHHFNPSYLSRFFKQERGINLSEYIDKCRIVRAKELIRSGDLKIKEVADAVGYEAAHSFTRFFKKMTGITPQDYRDNLIHG